MNQTMNASHEEEKPTMPYNNIKIKSLNNKYLIVGSIKSRSKSNYTLEELNAYIKTKTTGYEAIYGQVKPYADFDITYDTKEEQVNNEYNDIKSAVDGMSKCFNCPKDDIVILTANGQKSNNKWINSIHLIVNNNKVFKCGHDLKSILNNYTWPDKIKPDLSVYKRAGKRQLFRLAYCSKEGENRPFVLTTINYKNNCEKEESSFYAVNKSNNRVITEDMLISTTNDAVVTIAGKKEPMVKTESNDLINKAVKTFNEILPEEAKHHTYRDYDKLPDGKITVNFDRIEPSMCLFCNREHDRDNTAYLLFHPSNGDLLYSCTKKKKNIKMMSLLTNKKNRRSIIEAAINRRSRPGEMERLKTKIRNAFRRIIKQEELIECNNRYCADIEGISKAVLEDQVNILGVRANMGTGKTYMNVLQVRELLKNKPNARVLIVSMRVTLADKYKEDYGNMGFILYRDNKKILNSNLIICQLDSLGRVKWRPINETEPWCCDMVVIDETTQAIKHLSSSTYAKQRASSANFEKLKYLIRYSKQIILMDAGLDSDSIHWVRNLRYKTKNTDTIKIFWNHYIDKKRHIIIHPNKEGVVNLIKQEQNKYKRSYICCNYSTDTIKAIDRTLNESTNNSLLMTSETLNDEPVKKALQCVNEEWGRYNRVTVSPSVQGGISYDTVYNKGGVITYTKPFNSVYGIFNNLTNSSKDICQMLRRVRAPENDTINICISEFYLFNYFKDEAEYEQYLVSNREDIMGDIAQLKENCPYEYNELGLPDFIKNDYYRLYIKNKVRESHDRAGYLDNFIKQQILYGHTVSIAPDTEKDRVKEIKTDIKKTKEEIKEEEAVLLADSVLIDSIGLKELEEKIEKSPDTVTRKDKAQIKKHYLHKAYMLDPEIEYDPNFYLFYNDDKVRTNYKNQSLFHNKTYDEGLEDLKEIEIERERKNRSTETADSRHKADDGHLIMKSLNCKYKYSKFKILCGWLSELGFDTLTSDYKIKKQDLKNKLLRFINELKADKNISLKLGKLEKNMKAIYRLDSSDSKFIKSSLKFINGSFNAEFGVSVKQIKKRGDDFRLVNPYVEEMYFNDGDNGASMYAPVLGRTNSYYEERESRRDEEIDRIPTTDEKLDLLCMIAKNI